ncbi:hypothetical protein BST14_04310 [Mycobacterium arosiense ATCC BAA-1401 = DSM 45069]|uniref:Thioester reductase (TE) domain-containing protein n=1 Tax=Mycobacterium arosiense ATCC BAA-1401 = DSM 45069 TaxID=1265311 RepID=A0A1W9ZQ35_MYCAI|nr:hypothetical protein BST14_04310 [Mycobacterium arosiense ATCC BAA-1401 = DSM 45069]
MSGRFRQLADQHLRVLVGDVGAPNLGLDTPTYERLAETVDLVVHSAALVNHVLPYSQLFGPNVVGTAEIIKLAITKRLKPINYISTVAVTTLPDGNFFGEDVDVRSASPSRSLDELDASGDPQRAHYDGLPADFTAEAIATLGARARQGYHTYNVLNTHDDGISLDTFVDWLIAGGHRIERVDDYQQWLARFTEAMRALPDNQRKNSLLPLMSAYAKPGQPTQGTGMPAEKFRAAVQSAGIGSDNDVPHVTKALIDKYVTDLQRLGLLRSHTGARAG